MTKPSSEGISSTAINLNPSTSSTSRPATNNDSIVTPDESLNSLTLNFPRKLHLILSTSDYNDIICWFPHGRAWRVLQQERLEKEVLPKFFQHQKMKSFTRQIYGWGFQRINTGTDFNGFYHELFLRDAPDLCHKMRRPTRSENAERKRNLPDSPPNFYQMAPVSESNQANNSDNNETSSPPLSLEDYKDKVVRQLCTYSQSARAMYLNVELAQLGRKRTEVLQQLQELIGNIPDTTSHLVSNNAPPAVVRLPSFHFPDPMQHQSSIIPGWTMGVETLAERLSREQYLRDQARILFGLTTPSGDH